MTTKTHDPRVRVANHGTGNWRTEVQDEPGASWDITGPPYPTKAEALLHVDETAERCFDSGISETQAEGGLGFTENGTIASYAPGITPPGGWVRSRPTQPRSERGRRR
jgi:hypothetical protein